MSIISPYKMRIPPAQDQQSLLHTGNCANQTYLYRLDISHNYIPILFQQLDVYYHYYCYSIRKNQQESKTTKENKLTQRKTVDLVQNSPVAP